MHRAPLSRAVALLSAAMLFAIPGACAAKEAPAASATAPKESPMSTSPAAPQPETSLGENQVVSVEGYKVALAKCWEEEKAGAKVLVAWLSVVKEGADTGAKDLELSPGDELSLGSASYEITAVRLETSEHSGSVSFRKK